MFAVANILIALGQVLHVLLNLYMWIVIIGALITWVNPDPYNPIVRFLYSVTEPALGWFRRRLPFLRLGGFDLSPIVVIAVIIFLDTALARSLIDTGLHMKMGF
ncbi:MAG: YggT family protein [Thermodesulfobacteriota bacterium]|nr:YggT family protein [Thermodesulfobacteriota bacterium]